MGRVSRILKSPLTNSPHLGRTALEIGARQLDDDLPCVLAAWPHLPEQFKRTIMTLIEVAQSQVQRPAKSAPFSCPNAEHAPVGAGKRALVS